MFWKHRRLVVAFVGLVIAGLVGLLATSTVSSHEEDHEGPSFEVQVLRDPVEGWNVLIATDMIFAPERVSTGHVEGEGHAHIYVDGVKVSRIYGMWHYLGDLEPGEHEVRIELSQNDHAPLIVGDHVLDQTVTIEQPEPAEPTATPEPREVPTEQPIPTISAEAAHDPAGGFNLKIELDNFELAPVKASRAPEDGEGHARLYLNGEYVTRIYEEWTQITGLEVGQHEITVALVGNDHAPLTHEGSPIQTSFILDATEELLADSGEHSHGHSDGMDDHMDMDSSDEHEDMDMEDDEHEHTDDETDMDMEDDEEPMRDMATG